MYPTGAREELIPPTMPAVYLPSPSSHKKHRHPKPSNLVYKSDFPTPKRTELQYLVKVHATALCRGELEWPHLLHRRETAAVIGHDICGTVLSTPHTDEHVREGPKFKVGDEVFGFIEQSRDGGAADCVAVEEWELGFRPKNLRAVEAAGLGMTGLMAYRGLQGLIEEIGNGNGKGGMLRVLVLDDGERGVGVTAVQMLRSKSLMGGASVWVCVATASDDEPFWKDELKVDEILTCDKDLDLVNMWREKGWEPVHLVFDCAGGETFKQAHDPSILRKEGKITTTVESYGGPLSVEPDASQLEIIGTLAEKGELKPYIDKVFELHEAEKAMEYLQSNKVKGRVVLRVNYD